MKSWIKQMSKVLPYPTPWTRMVDMFPSLHYSIKLDPDVQMRQYKGHISTSAKVAKPFKSKPVKTELGSLSINPVNRTVLNYKAGSPDNATNFKPKDVWNEIQANLDVPDVMGKQRTILKPIPKALTQHDLLSIEAPLIIEETARGCFPQKLREVTRLPLFNIIRHGKNELMLRGLADVDSLTRARFRRMRSIWKTHTIHGWSELGSIIRPLCQELTKDQWFQDSIEIKGFQVPINHVVVDGQIYTMRKLSRLLAI